MDTKENVRTTIWKKLDESGIADFPLPCFGRIPNFKGSASACFNLSRIEEYRAARCVFCAPDHVLSAARRMVLGDGKTLAAALPHMEKFVELTPEGGRKNISIKGLKKGGKPLRTPVDLVVLGSVAVDMFGNRLGKGSGYGDREVDYLKKSGLLSPGARVATIVHSAQIVEDLSSLMGEFDIGVDCIVTEGDLIVTSPSLR